MRVTSKEDANFYSLTSSEVVSTANLPLDKYAPSFLALPVAGPGHQSGTIIDFPLVTRRQDLQKKHFLLYSTGIETKDQTEIKLDQLDAENSCYIP